MLSTNPNYVNVIQNYRESVWTYLGRSLYEAKRYEEARKAWNEHLHWIGDDQLAKLYLGLTLIRDRGSVSGSKGSRKRHERNL